MSRSPLAYPLTRGVDGDAGGAADLQTDIMRFMAILALCLVAIFALVQSIPLAPPVTKPEPVAATNAPPEQPAITEVVRPEPAAAPDPVIDEPVVLTRPAWQPRSIPEREVVALPEPRKRAPVAAPEPAPESAPPAMPTTAKVGFTLRFESDLALTRLVASNQVGFHAIASGRSLRMAVSDSRISFWDASTPNAFHEMEATTVPDPVVDALRRTGADSGGIKWGVTLPGKLSQQLQTVMRENDGGALVIGADGQLRREAQ